MAATTLLPDSFALRIAYLYAPDDLVPIFRRRILERCAFALGFVSGDADWASLQRFICDRQADDRIDDVGVRVDASEDAGEQRDAVI